jgi:hypothetical protein
MSATSKTFTPIVMIQECINKERVFVGGIYERADGRMFIAKQLVMGKSTLYVIVESCANNEIIETISVKRFYKTFTLRGI